MLLKMAQVVLHFLAALENRRINDCYFTSRAAMVTQQKVPKRKKCSQITKVIESWLFMEIYQCMHAWQSVLCMRFFVGCAICSSIFIFHASKVRYAPFELSNAAVKIQLAAQTFWQILQ